MKKHVHILVVTLSVLVGCGRLQLSPQIEPPCHSVILIDPTASMHEFFPRLLEELSKLLAGLRTGDSLEIYKVGVNPMADPPIAVVATPAYDSSQETRALFQAKVAPLLARQTRDAFQRVKALLAAEPSSNADLTDGLEVAARSFRAFPAPVKRLYVFSDLQEDYGYAQLVKGKLNGKQTDQIIDQIKAEGRLPDLADVEVWVIGSRIHHESPRSVEDQLERFWIQIVTKCGAHTNTDHFGPYLRRNTIPLNPATRPGNMSSASSNSGMEERGNDQ